MIAADIEEVLQREVAYLDDQRWDDWLSLFAADCEYWAPTWKTDAELTDDPHTELSHVYYSNRAGLADRIARILSTKAIASRPLPRSAHTYSGLMLTSAPTVASVSLRTTWVSHVFFPRNRDTKTFFGSAEYVMARDDGRWLIKKKKIVLKNDYIPTLMDIYCL